MYGQGVRCDVKCVRKRGSDATVWGKRTLAALESFGSVVSLVTGENRRISDQFFKNAESSVL